MKISSPKVGEVPVRAEECVNRAWGSDAGRHTPPALRATPSTLEGDINSSPKVGEVPVRAEECVNPAWGQRRRAAHAPGPTDHPLYLRGGHQLLP